jgi:hypothetical protein
MAEEAQRRQAAEIAEERRKVKAVQDGQLINAMTGGTAGLLAYADKLTGGGMSKLGGGA